MTGVTLIDALTLVTTIGIAIITFWYARITHRILKSTNDTYNLNREISITDIHSRFQSDMRDIQLKFPIKINDDNIKLNDADKRHIQMYWYLIFDEYLTCKKMSTDPELNKLWDNFYIKGVQSALKREVFKTEIIILFNSGASFFEFREDFLKELTKANGENPLI